MTLSNFFIAKVVPELQQGLFSDKWAEKLQLQYELLGKLLSLTLEGFFKK